jgi:hypothetical protein
MSDLVTELAAAGGVRAPARTTARLRQLLLAGLDQGRAELGRARSGSKERPVTVAMAGAGDRLLAAIPVDAALRVDRQAADERAWLLVAAAVGAMVQLTDPGPPNTAGDLSLLAGALEDHLVLAVAAPGLDPDGLDDLVPLSFDEQVHGIDRLRAGGLAVPAAVLADAGAFRAPIGPGHPLRIAETVARLGGRPAEPRSVEDLDEAVLAVIDPSARGPSRPHEDPDPARRVARRILQRLDGMGKWGGYHTDFAHLARGFAGNDRALAQEVGEALLASGLLAEKPSVGQRHVFLNPRRAGDIKRLIEAGEDPVGLVLPG